MGNPWYSRPHYEVYAASDDFIGRLKKMCHSKRFECFGLKHEDGNRLAHGIREYILAFVHAKKTNSYVVITVHPRRDA